jgi:membrane protease YdiL (CAAX protease family)
MSIVHDLHLPAIFALTVPGELWLLPLLAVSFVAAALAGVVPPRRAAGPDRIPPTRPAAPLLGVMLGALGVYFFVASLYEIIEHPAGAQTATTRVTHDGTSEVAFLSAVPPLLAFLALLLGGIFAHDVSGQDLGLGLQRFRKGVAWGLLGVLIVIPPLTVVTQILDLIYRHLHYQHPTEHPLLHTLGQKPGSMETALILAGVCIIAPLAEELFFRGYVQTLLRRLFQHLYAGRAQAMPPTSVPTWLAIGSTSLLFAAVHEMWTWPVIFILALCLGYAYERTGNLWVPITLHAGFNTLSTAVFLLGLYAPH